MTAQPVAAFGSWACPTLKPDTSVMTLFLETLLQEKAMIPIVFFRGGQGVPARKKVRVSVYMKKSEGKSGEKGLTVQGDVF